MDLNAVMNARASVSGDDADAAMTQQKQDQETAEALRSIRQSGSVRSDIARHSDDEGDSVAIESDDDKQRHSAGQKSSGDARRGDQVSAGGDIVNAKAEALLKTAQHNNSNNNKRKRSDGSLDRSSARSSSTNGAQRQALATSQSPAVVVRNEPKRRSERESSSSSLTASHQSTPPAKPSRMLRKLSGTAAGTSDQSPKAVDVKIKDEAAFAIGAGASTANISAAFLATQAFASPRDFFVSPTGGTADSGEGGHVVCTLCQVTIGSRIYSLKRHLYRHHPQVFRIKTESESAHTGATAAAGAESKLSLLDGDLDGQEPAITLKLESPGVSLVTSKRKGSRATAGGGSSDASSSLAFEKMNDAFVTWLRSDIIPMKAIESELFHRFLSEINPLFKIPQVIVQPRQSPKLATGDLGEASAAPADYSKTRFMKGLCLQGNGMAPMLRTDLEIPTPKANEALIKIVRAGICGTDLMMIDNYKPGFKGVIGHEFVGIVQQVGGSSSSSAANPRDVPDDDDDSQGRDARARKREQAWWWIGKRVVGEINVPCDADECSTCSRAHPQHDPDRRRHPQPDRSTTERDGARETTNPAVLKRRNHCPSRTAIGIVGKNGVFAEFITLPLANLHVVPESVVDAHAVFAEPLAAACRILEQQTIQPHDRVAILGDGKLGLLVAEVLHASGGGASETTLIGKHVEKMALMRHVVTHALTLDAVASSDSGHHERFDVCVECTGTPTGMSLALQLLKRGGVLVMKSTCSAKKSPVDLELVHAKQARVVGSRCGPFDMAMGLLKDKKVDVQKFIHGVYPLARAEAALAHAATRGALKIQLVIA